MQIASKIIDIFMALHVAAQQSILTCVELKKSLAPKFSRKNWIFSWNYTNLLFFIQNTIETCFLWSPPKELLTKCPLSPPRSFQKFFVNCCFSFKTPLKHVFCEVHRKICWLNDPSPPPRSFQKFFFVSCCFSFRVLLKHVFVKSERFLI